MTGTGQKSTLTLSATSGLPKLIAITPPSFEGDTVPRPTLDLDAGDAIPMDPGDLVTPGVITVEVEHDEAFDPPLQVKQNAIITYPIPAGLTNAATDTHTDAFILSYTPNELRTGTRRTANLSIQVRDRPTKAAAS